MTEAHWLSCTDPATMLGFLCDQATDRKLRLFFCACCRKLDVLVPDSFARKAVKTAERYADGEVGPQKLRYAWGDVRRTLNQRNRSDPERIPTAQDQALYLVSLAVATQVRALVRYQNAVYWPLTRAKESGLVNEQAIDEPALLRDIFGRSFCSHPAISSDVLEWHSGTIPKLSGSIYADRAFDRLPILADALEDAGCDDADILTHCRGGGEHVRGCWVVDLILGKE